MRYLVVSQVRAYGREHRPGKELELSEDDARMAVRSGHLVPVKTAPKKTAANPGGAAAAGGTSGDSPAATPATPQSTQLSKTEAKKAKKAAAKKAKESGQ